MTLPEIKNAVRQGKEVYWLTPAYRVTTDKNQQWMIKCLLNGHSIGLTWYDGTTLNAPEDEFFVNEEKQVSF